METLLKIVFTSSFILKDIQRVIFHFRFYYLGSGREASSDTQGQIVGARGRSVQAEAWCERKFTGRAGEPLRGYL